jgi:hypothetical protein
MTLIQGGDVEMTYKLRYSLFFPTGGEDARLELEREYHDSIAPAEALSSLKEEMDDLRCQVIERQNQREIRELVEARS